MKKTELGIVPVLDFSVSVWEEGEGAGIKEQVFEMCSIISRGTVSTAGCLDLQKYADVSDDDRAKRSSSSDEMLVSLYE